MCVQLLGHRLLTSHEQQSALFKAVVKACNKQHPLGLLYRPFTTHEQQTALSKLASFREPRTTNCIFRLSILMIPECRTRHFGPRLALLLVMLAASAAATEGQNVGRRINCDTRCGAERRILVLTRTYRFPNRKSLFDRRSPHL